LKDRKINRRNQKKELVVVGDGIEGDGG